MGPVHEEFGSLIEGRPLFALSGPSAMVDTSSLNFPTPTDSAASATAYSCGEKTWNGRVGIDGAGDELINLVQLSLPKGLRTGVITTARMAHATPAAFSSHQLRRGDYSLIAADQEDSGVNVLMGGDRSPFTRNMSAQGYETFESLDGMLAVPPNAPRQFGLFTATGHLPYEWDRDLQTTPSLAQMTERAVAALAGPSGANAFFLLVEGARVDHAGHANDLLRNPLETIALDAAVGAALRLRANVSELMVLVTADHETGGLKVAENASAVLQASGIAAPSAGMGAEARRDVRKARAMAARDGGAAQWSTGSHTGVDVSLHSLGWDGMVRGVNRTGTVIDNTDVFKIIFDYLELNYSLVPPTPPPPITSTATSSSSSSSSSSGDSSNNGFVSSGNFISSIF